MYHWEFTKEEKAVVNWQRFLSQNSRAPFLQLYHRFSSYENVGFLWELQLCVDERGEILMGSANVFVKLPGIKIYICSHGPIHNCSHINEGLIVDYINHFNKRAVESGCSICQLTYPVELEADLILGKGYTVGRIFDDIAVYEKLNVLKLTNSCGDKLDRDSIISKFTNNGRRDSRASYRKGLTSKILVLESDIREAYSCIESNASVKGYFVRSWREFRESILAAVNAKAMVIIAAYYGNEIQGAVILEGTSGVLNYTMGGVKRHHPDLLTGYFLQVEALVFAVANNFELYNISVGGPPNVQRFKSMFNPELINVGLTFHLLLPGSNNKIKSWLFINIIHKGVKWLKRNRKVIELIRKFI
jgi:hypothetical protein